jgi:hypothetical protein
VGGSEGVRRCDEGCRGNRGRRCVGGSEGRCDQGGGREKGNRRWGRGHVAEGKEASGA